MEGPLEDAVFVVTAVVLAYGMYTTVGMLFQTSVPVVAVTTGSMQPELNPGDMVVVYGTAWDDIEVSDIVVYRTGQASIPIIHRVVRKNASALETKGDSNAGQLPFEHHVTEEQVLGTTVFAVPFVGYVKLIPYCLLLEGDGVRSPMVCSGLPL